MDARRRLLLWLLPNGEATTTTSETTSTSKTGADAGETTVTKTGTSTKPGDGVSETLIGVLLGTGAILVLVAAFWDRIQEVGLPGGASLKLSAARAKSIGLDDVADAIQREGGAAAGDAAAAARMMSSLASHIVDKARDIAAGETRVVRVDLGDGQKWLLPNLYFLVWVLERWTRVSLVVFTKSEGTRQIIYFACATPADLRRQLAESEPLLAGPTQRAEDEPLSQAAPAFFGGLAEGIEASASPAGQAAPALWVSPEVLMRLADPALTYESVEIACDDDLSSDELRAILCFTHRFVPITKKKRFTTTVDKCRVSLELARPLVRAEQASAG